MSASGTRVRTVIGGAAVNAWTSAAGITASRLFRAINKGDRITGESMTPQAIFETVRHYAPRPASRSPRPKFLDVWLRDAPR